ncbi:hypothetical protein V2J09_022206 [Rumex salicifolius]
MGVWNISTGAFLRSLDLFSVFLTSSLLGGQHPYSHIQYKPPTKTPFFTILPLIWCCSSKPLNTLTLKSLGVFDLCQPLPHSISKSFNPGGHLVYSLKSQKAYVSRDVHFLEHILPYHLFGAFKLSQS